LYLYANIVHNNAQFPASVHPGIRGIFSKGTNIAPVFNCFQLCGRYLI
jgi:hypothetical protein